MIIKSFLRYDKKMQPIDSNLIADLLPSVDNPSLLLQTIANELESALFVPTKLTQAEVQNGKHNVFDLSRIPTEDFLGLYMEENSEQTLLTAAQEIQLAKAIEAGKKLDEEAASQDEKFVLQDEEATCTIRLIAKAARRRLIRANTRLVISFAKQYRGQGLDFIDLIQEGNVGLLTAVDKYNHELGNRFSTYASWWIRQGITRALSNYGRMIRLPAHLGTPMRQLYLGMQSLEQNLGRKPKAEEVAAHIEMPLEQVRQLMRLTQPLLNLEQPAGSEQDSELGDFIEDVKAAEMSEVVGLTVLKEHLNSVVDQLPTREAQILRLHYGLQGHQPHTLREIGALYGLSRERIRQLEKSALRILRQPDMAGNLKIYAG